MMVQRLVNDTIKHIEESSIYTNSLPDMRNLFRLVNKGDILFKMHDILDKEMSWRFLDVMGKFLRKNESLFDRENIIQMNSILHHNLISFYDNLLQFYDTRYKILMLKRNEIHKYENKTDFTTKMEKEIDELEFQKKLSHEYFESALEYIQLKYNINKKFFYYKRENKKNLEMEIRVILASKLNDFNFLDQNQVLFHLDKFFFLNTKEENKLIKTQSYVNFKINLT